MLSPGIREQLINYVKEDEGKGDVTALITPQAKCMATIKTNEKCMLAGIEETLFLFSHYSLKAKALKKDGSPAEKGEKIIEIRGDNRKILTLERACLNILGRMSGVATLCAKAKKKTGGRTVLAVTRKTVPGFQLLDKKAAQAAGLWSHRKNLGEMILLKDNHIKFFRTTLDAAEAAAKTGKKFEIEAESEWQALSSATAGPAIIMLDNFRPKKAKETITALRKTHFKGKIELSGGITLKNLGQYSRLGADIISMGELTKKARILDFSLDIAKVYKLGHQAKWKGAAP